MEVAARFPAAVASGRATDPIFGRSIAFLSLYAAGLGAGARLVDDACGLDLRDGRILFRGGQRLCSCGRPGGRADPALRGVALAWAAFLLVLAARSYIGRFERLFDDHTIFTGVTYTEAHVTLDRHADRGGPAGARRRWSRRSARSPPRASAGSIAAALPAAVAFLATGARRRLHEAFIVKPNELVRERPVHRAQHRDSRGRRTASTGSRSAPFPGRDDGSRPSTRRTTRRRSRTSGCGTGARCRTRCARSRKSAPTTTSPTSTSIATRSTARSGR